jgi:hypothetical protein
VSRTNGMVALAVGLVLCSLSTINSFACSFLPSPGSTFEDRLRHYRHVFVGTITHIQDLPDDVVIASAQVWEASKPRPTREIRTRRKLFRVAVNNSVHKNDPPGYEFEQPEGLSGGSCAFDLFRLPVGTRILWADGLILDSTVIDDNILVDSDNVVFQRRTNVIRRLLEGKGIDD